MPGTVMRGEAARGLPPGPRAALGGHLLDLKRDPLGFLTRLREEHGDVAAVRFGPQLVVLVSDPAGVEEVLVRRHRDHSKGRALDQAKRLLGNGLLTTHGEFHHQQRRIVQPVFHHQRIRGYAAIMAEAAQRAAARWRSGQVVDVDREMMRLSLAVVGKALFDADVEEEAPEVGRALMAGMEMIDRFWWPGYALLAKLPLPSTLRFRRARAHLDGIIHGMMAERRRTGTAGRQDLLSMLMEAEDPERPGHRMSPAQVRDEAMTIFLAGHETTANAMTWTWHLLGRHPAAWTRLRAELDEVLDGGARPPAMEDVPRLAFTRQVLAEAMRCYPPAWVLGRRALVETQVLGHRVPRGTIVLLSQWVTHRHPGLWPDPDRFDPDRFAPEAEAARPRFAYFPFGGGPHGCVGERFAWMEGVLGIATIAQRWRLEPAPAEAPPVPHPTLTLRPRDGLRMVARPAASP